MGEFDIRLASERDADFAADIWREVSTWLMQVGKPLWAPDEFSSDGARRLARFGELVIGWRNSVAISCMTLQRADPIFWPGESEGAALYVHKLAVRRSFAGSGLPRAMLDWAALRASNLAVPAIRLDCDPRPQLIKLYSACGFTRVDPGPVIRGGYTVMRFERAAVGGAGYTAE
jgi:GNAT superfamily N-acetyltransferase